MKEGGRFDRRPRSITANRENLPVQMQRRISFSPRPPPPPPFPVTLPQLDYTKLPEFPSVSTIKGRAGGGVSGKVVRELLSLSLCVSVCLSLSLSLCER